MCFRQWGIVIMEKYYMPVVRNHCKFDIGMLREYLRHDNLHRRKSLVACDDVGNCYHQNVFFLREEKINKIISNYNIIEKYTVQKIYPSRLNIIIQPTEFIAQISGDNQLLVGANGKLILNEGDGTYQYLTYLENLILKNF